MLPGNTPTSVLDDLVAATGIALPHRRPHRVHRPQRLPGRAGSVREKSLSGRLGVGLDPCGAGASDSVLEESTALR